MCVNRSDTYFQESTQIIYILDLYMEHKRIWKLFRVHPCYFRRFLYRMSNIRKKITKLKNTGAFVATIIWHSREGYLYLNMKITNVERKRRWKRQLLPFTVGYKREVECVTDWQCSTVKKQKRTIRSGDSLVRIQISAIHNSCWFLF